MNKKIVILLLFVGLFLAMGIVFAQGSDVTITKPNGVPENFPDLLEKIATGVGDLIAALGVIMIIVAGILYLTSAGSPEKIGTAKKALIYAIAGIAIGLAAKAIVGIVTDVIGTT